MPKAHVNLNETSVEVLVRILGAERARYVILDALCERRIDEPAPWLTDDSLLTERQWMTLIGLEERVRMLSTIPRLTTREIARMADGADTIHLNVGGSAEVAEWLDRGARMTAPGHAGSRGEEVVLDVGLVARHRDTDDGKCILLATIHYGQHGDELAWLVWDALEVDEEVAA